MKIFVAKENTKFESRVAVTPDIAQKFVESGHEIFIETNAGQKAQFDDSDYVSAFATICKRDFLSQADVVLSVNSLESEDIKTLKPKTFVISIQEPHQNEAKIHALKNAGVTSFGLDLVPRTTKAQYMDVLSSQSNLAGYKAVIEAAHLFNRGFPLMMTTAGTIKAARVLVVGAGVAGLSAIATAKRLGAIVSAFDVRKAAKEQIESLGGKFIEIEQIDDSGDFGNQTYATQMTKEYQNAQENQLRAILPNQNIVITTAQIPFQKAPIIIKTDMLDSMNRGSIVIDLASKTGGNCEQTKHGQTIDRNGVQIVAFENILNLISHDASKLFAKNVFAFFELLCLKIQNQTSMLDIDDDIIQNMLITCENKISKEVVKKCMNLC